MEAAIYVFLTLMIFLLGFVIVLKRKEMENNRRRRKELRERAIRIHELMWGEFEREEQI